MSRDNYDFSDSALALEDKTRREAGMKACDKHLADLMRVHGGHPEPRRKGHRRARRAGRGEVQPDLHSSVL
jgi:hypothetical protein